MPHRLLRRRLTQALERLLLRGPLSRLLVVALLIGGIALVAGLLASAGSGQFTSPWAGIWWAFLRLTDPGYLGDDQGTFLRIVSTVVTVLGYVLFLGALVAIMTQWLNATVVRLQRGLTPLVRRGHLVVLGWNARTPVIVRELVSSEERVERFLLTLGARDLHVAILAEELTPEIRQDLRERLAEEWDEAMITFRTGTPLRAEHLARVDALNALAVILPAPPLDPHRSLSPDAWVLKALLALDALAREAGMPPPPVVTELQDERKFALLESAYSGPLEILASDQLVARLLAQTVRHPGASAVYRELFSDREGSEVRVREVPDLAGLRFEEARARFRDAIPIGLVRQSAGRVEPLLNPDPAVPLEPGDMMVVVSRDFRSADPAARPMERVPAPPSGAGVRQAPAEPAVRRVVLLGWNGRVPALIQEFDRATGDRFELDILARLDVLEQHEALRSAGALPRHIMVRHHQGEKSSPSDVARLDPASAHHVVVLASDWLESPEEADARTMLAFLVVSEQVAGAARRPHLVVELLDEENAALLPRGPLDEVLVSSLMTSYGVSQVALRRELRAVYEELFGPDGPEIVICPLEAYGLAPGTFRFGELEAAARARGDLALGIRVAGAVQLTPPRQDPLTLAAGDALVVIARAVDS